jgi:hypothetical protein
MRSGSQAHEVLAKSFPAKAQRRKVSEHISSLRLCAFAGEASPVLSALGPGSFAEFQAIRFPGTVLWCNFDLLRELGFDVPQTNQLTPKLTEQLLASLSLRAVAAKDDVCGKELLTLHADKYGGVGVSPALGAGRAGFLPHGNLYVKGLGFTPLFRHDDADDFVHSHGGVHLEDCLSEAVFGEVNHNLFTLGSNRIAAIIDQGKHVTEPSGRRRHIALAIRAGAQLRPGHLLARRGRGARSPIEMFISITCATKQLVNRVATPDVSATMLRVIDDHAQTAADSFRWRMIHGALSPSNMDITGAMLDLATQSTQPRTAPIFKLDYAESSFGTEHKERGFYLAEMYRRVLRATDPVTRDRLNVKWINVSNEMDKAYEKHLQIKLLAAAGLKTALAQHVQADHADLASRFTALLVQMASLKNPGSAWVARRVVEDVSVVDVFNLLRQAPRDYFAATAELSQERVFKHLKPVYKGNHFHVAKKREQVNSFASRFVVLYRELMRVAEAYTGDYYDDEAAMRSSITARAAFENEPIEGLYTYRLYEKLNQAIADYKITGNADRIRDAIDNTVVRSLRSVDGLLAQGESRRLADGGIELEKRAIQGISYAVRAWDDRAQTRTIHVSISPEANVPGLNSLTRGQLQSLRYRFTADGWKTSGEAPSRMRQGGLVDFEVCVSSLIGHLEGCFVGDNVKTGRIAGYAFVIPDRHDLTKYLPQRRKDAKLLLDAN